jgi:hypothetical protein
MSFISELERRIDASKGFGTDTIPSVIYAQIGLKDFLVLHADEIAELVKAADKVTENVVDAEQMRLNALDLIMLKDALANLNKEKS